MNMIESLIVRITHRFFQNGYYSSNKSLSFKGDYSTWEDAQKNSTGYDSDLILNKVKESLLKVKEGKAAYERDSVLFYHIEYSYPLLCGLLRVAAENGGYLNVLDFGGSLGSSYFQNRVFLSGLKKLKWNIVEQEKFVRVGKDYFEDKSLHFYNTIDECLVAQKPDVVLLSSVLQYIDVPYNVLSKILEQKIPYIIVDRTPFFDYGRDILTVQRVPLEIYDASYPAWFFDEQKFIDMVTCDYSLVFSDNTPDGQVIIDNCIASYMIMMFRLKDAIRLENSIGVTSCGNEFSSR